MTMPVRRRVLLGWGAAAVALATGGVLVPRVLENQRRKTTLLAEQAEWRRHVESIQYLPTEGLIDRMGLDGFMRYWNEQVIQRLRSAHFPLDAIQADIVNSGTLFLPPASNAELAALQSRLGITLPPSLKALLAQANGVKGIIDYVGANKLDILQCAQFDWLHRVDKQLVDIWNENDFAIPDSNYFVYGKQQDPVNMRASYLRRSIAISPVEDGGVFLLNPQIVFPDGEMEAWDFSVKYPGAIRYRSLYRLLEAHCQSSCRNLELWSLSHEWERTHGKR